MKGKSKITYLALAMAFVVLTTTFAIAFEDANARVVTVSGWQMELNQIPDRVNLSSNVLEKGNTVILNDLSVRDTREFTVTLTAENGTASGGLYCTTDNYLVAQCSDRQENFEETEFSITLHPTQAAMELTQAVTSVMKVYWNDELWANFQVTLLPDTTLDQVAEDGDTGENRLEQDDSMQPDFGQLAMAEDFLTGMTAFDPEEFLVVQVTVPQYCDRLELGLDGEVFPTMTRFSTDGGTTFITLYDSMPLVVETGDAQIITLLLDLQDAGISSERMTVYATGYYGEVSRGVDHYDVETTVELPELDIPGEIIVLNESITLETSFQRSFGGAEANVALGRVDGTVDRPVYVTNDGDKMTIQTTGNGERAKAGAYLMKVTWYYQDIPVATREMKFYVNYTNYVPS